MRVREDISSLFCFVPSVALGDLFYSRTQGAWGLVSAWTEVYDQGWLLCSLFSSVLRETHCLPLVRCAPLASDNDDEVAGPSQSDSHALFK